MLSGKLFHNNMEMEFKVSYAIDGKVSWGVCNSRSDGTFIINNIKNMGTSEIGAKALIKNGLRKLYKINVYITEVNKQKIEIFAESKEEAEKLVSEGKYYSSDRQVISIETKLGKIKRAK